MTRNLMINRAQKPGRICRQFIFQTLPCYLYQFVVFLSLDFCYQSIYGLLLDLIDELAWEGGKNPPVIFSYPEEDQPFLDPDVVDSFQSSSSQLPYSLMADLFLMDNHESKSLEDKV